MEKINLGAKLALFADRWRPKVLGELNGQHVKPCQTVLKPTDSPSMPGSPWA